MKITFNCVRNTFLGGLFLLALGLGNSGVGYFKGNQYEIVAGELTQLEEPGIFTSLSDEAASPGVAVNDRGSTYSSFPLMQIDSTKHASERLLQRRQKAIMRRDLYRLVYFGGKVIVAAGALCLLFSCLLWLVYIRETEDQSDFIGSS